MTKPATPQPSIVPSQGIDAVLARRASVETAGRAAPVPAAPAEFSLVQLEQLDSSPDQAREAIDDDYLASLAENIRANKLLQPIVVRPIDGRFQIVAGHCRTEAYRRLRDAAPEAERAQWSSILARIIKVSDEQAAVLCLSENLERENLTPVEEGSAFARMMDKYGYTTAKTLALRLGVDEQRVARRLRLFQAPMFLKESVSRGIKVEPRNGNESEVGKRKETRKLAFDVALEFLRLHMHYLRKYPGLEPRKADPRPIADLKAQPVVERALAEGWSRQKVRAFVDHAIGGRATASTGDGAAEVEPIASTQNAAPLWEKKGDRLVIHLRRLESASAQEREQVLHAVRGAMATPLTKP